MRKKAKPHKPRPVRLMTLLARDGFVAGNGACTCLEHSLYREALRNGLEGPWKEIRLVVIR